MTSKNTMTKNNEIKKNASGGDAQKSMGGGKNKVNPAKSELIELSNWAKGYRKLKIDKAETEAEALYWASCTINDILIMSYQKTSGAEEFKTFNQWREKGYQVKKGSKAYRVWGRPINAKHKEEQQKPDATDEEKTGYEYFPMCCVFSDLQVEKSGGDPEGGKIQKAEKVDQATPPAPVEVKQPATTSGNIKLANKLAEMADKLQSKIDSCFADREENTPKRIAQAASTRQEGYRLQRTQKALYALAELHKAGDVPAALGNIKTKKAVYDLVAMQKEPVSNGWHSYYVETNTPASDSEEAKAIFALINGELKDNTKAEEQKAKINSLQFANIPGYFPTPKDVIQTMLEHADIENGQHILEPNAGNGAIADTLKDLGATVECYEINFTLYEILKDKGHAVGHRNFLEVEPIERADRVLMNPPFEKLQDVDHVQHAFNFLKPGGVLVAIMSPAGFFHSTKKAEAFRTWFTSLDGYAEDLPEGSFKQSGTSVRTKLVVIRKPLEASGDDDSETNPFVCDNYQGKQDAREARYSDRAAAASSAAASAWQRGREMASVIPFGQPILVGHHSEKRDRRYRAKIEGQFRKSVELRDKAAYNAGKAASVGTGGIASDDPEAIQKLKEQLLQAEEKQKFMREANKALRAGDDNKLKALGMSDQTIEKFREPDCVGRSGFADYQLSNNSANIRRLRQRIEDLENLRSQQPIEFKCDDFKLYVDDGRVHFDFQDKPSEEVRTILKAVSFKWSRYSMTWVRKATHNALYSAEQAKKRLLEVYEQGRE